MVSEITRSKLDLTHQAEPLGQLRLPELGEVMRVVMDERLCPFKLVSIIANILKTECPANPVRIAELTIASKCEIKDAHAEHLVNLLDRKRIQRVTFISGVITPFFNHRMTHRGHTCITRHVDDTIITILTGDGRRLTIEDLTPKKHRRQKVSQFTFSQDDDTFNTHNAWMKSMVWEASQ